MAKKSEELNVVSSEPLDSIDDSSKKDTTVSTDDKESTTTSEDNKQEKTEESKPEEKKEESKPTDTTSETKPETKSKIEAKTEPKKIVSLYLLKRKLIQLKKFQLTKMNKMNQCHHHSRQDQRIQLKKSSTI